MAKSSYKTNILYNSIYRCVVILTPLITSPYLSRVLGADKLGIYSYANAFATYFVIFSLLGVNDYGNRKIAQVKGRREALSDAFWQIYYLQLLLTIVLFAGYMVVVTLHAKYFLIQLILGIYVFSSVFEINWFAFGMEEFRLTSIRSIITRLGIVACIFLFVRTKNDLWKYALITTSGNMVSLIIILPLVKKYTDFRKPDIKKMFIHLKPSLVLFLPVIATSVYQQLSKLLLGVWSSEAEVGFFQNAENIVTLPTFITTAIVTVMLPYASNLVATGEEEKNRELMYRFIKYTSIVNIAMSFGILGIAQDFIPWYLGRSFERSAVLIMIMSPMIFIGGFSSIIRYQYLIPNEHDRANLISMFAGAGVDVILNIILIPLFGAVGASVAVVSAYLSTLVIQLAYGRKDLCVTDMIKTVIPFFGIGAIMLVVLNIVGRMQIPTVILVLCEVSTGALVYCIISAVYLKKTGDKIIDNILEKFRIRNRV